VFLDGGVRRVVDGLADCDVPAVDELELGHGVGVARRHVVDSFVVVVVVVGRRASRRAGEQERVWCGCDDCEEGGDGLCSGKKKMGEDDACCWSSFALPLDGETS
jgi:hypothetical protein